MQKGAKCDDFVLIMSLSSYYLKSQSVNSLISALTSGFFLEEALKMSHISNLCFGYILAGIKK